MLHGKHLSKSMCPKTQEERDNMSRIPYASAIGLIMYSMLCTRPDVSFSLSIASRFQANYGEEHWTAVKNILKYLRRTKDMFLINGDYELKASNLIVTSSAAASMTSFICNISPSMRFCTILLMICVTSGFPNRTRTCTMEIKDMMSGHM